MKHEADPFRTLYDANHQRVTRLLGRIVGPQDAEDLTQTVFAKAAKALPEFRGDAQASTWLYRIAANVASDWLRGRAAREAKVTAHLPEALDHEAGESAVMRRFLKFTHRRSKNSSARTSPIASAPRSDNSRKFTGRCSSSASLAV